MNTDKKKEGKIHVSTKEGIDIGSLQEIHLILA